MNKKRNPRRAVVLSVFTLLLCASMLIGSTFAWFTDSASTSLSNIQSGTLSVDIKDLEGETVTELSIQNLNGETDILWEPGATFALTPVQIVNTGSLALQFNLTVTGTAGAVEEGKDEKDVKNLADVIDVLKLDQYGSEEANFGTLSSVIKNNNFAHGVILPENATKPADAGKEVPVGTTGEYRLALKMQETAGNEYQNMKLTGVKITVNATQTPFEYDSYNNTYDAKAAEAMLPSAPSTPAAEPYVIDKDAKTITLNDAAGFSELVKGSEALGLGVNDYPDTYTVILANDITMNTTFSAPIKCWWGSLNGNGKTISGIKVVTTEQWAGLFKPGASENTLNISNLKLDDIHVSTTAADAFAGVVVGYSANASLDNITVTNSSVLGTKYSGGIIGQAGATNITNCSVSSTTVTGTRVGGIVGDAFNEGGTASVANCSVSEITVTNTAGTSGSAGSIAGRLRNGITATNCTATSVTGATEQVGVSVE